jgi:putative intracellular protease/amidase
MAEVLILAGDAAESPEVLHPSYSWPADVAFSEVDPAEYAALVVPGGRAPEYIRNDPDCRRIIRFFFRRKRPVAHLCHASLALAAAGVLQGRRTTAYPAWMREFVRVLRAHVAKQRPKVEERGSARGGKSR